MWTADQPDERRQGLRGVVDLPADIEGMVFTYGTPTSVSYEMEDTLIPLDIWWFGVGGVLLGRDEMTPCLESPCEKYRSPGPVTAVLETPLGQFDFSRGAVLSTVESG